MADPLEPRSVSVTVHAKVNRRLQFLRISDWSYNSIQPEVDFPSFYACSSLNKELLQSLLDLYCVLYPTHDLVISSLNTVCKRFTQITYQGTHFNCKSNPVIFVRNPVNMHEIRCATLDCTVLENQLNCGGKTCSIMS